MAGRFADLLDLHGDPKHGRGCLRDHGAGRGGGRGTAGGHRVRTSGGGIGLVRDAAEAAGRARDAVRVATQIPYVAFGSSAEVRTAEEELCARWAGIPYRPLDRSPYLLFGSPAQMAEALAERREAYGLERISHQRGERDRGRAAGPAPVLPCSVAAGGRRGAQPPSSARARRGAPTRTVLSERG